VKVVQAGFITAGNTGRGHDRREDGARAIPGVDRPALAAVFPTAVNTVAILLDVGANVDCKLTTLSSLPSWAKYISQHVRD